MFGYYLRLAGLSLRKHPALTALMVGAIALGLAVCMTALTVFHMMSANPIEHRSDVLYAVTLDGWDPDQPWDDDRPALPPMELTYRDAQALMRSEVPTRKLVMFKTGFIVQSEDPSIAPEREITRATYADFFAMFDTPFLYGGPWSEAADHNAEQVVVLSRELNERLFGGENSVGRDLMLGGRFFRVVGVLDDWEPLPKFYDLNNGSFDEPELLYVPFSLTEPLQLPRYGNTNCWKEEVIDSYAAQLASECVWIQAWVELADAAERDAYQSWLDGYVTEQKALGRFPRPLNNHLRTVDDWLDVNEVVRDDNRVLVGLAFMFLAVCLFNTVGLLLARFAAKASQVGLLRALGASKAAIFQQHLIEVAVVGLIGGGIGLALTLAGLAGVRLINPEMAGLARLDAAMVLAALAIALLSALAAGLYPTWRICRIQPAIYLKTQ